MDQLSWWDRSRLMQEKGRTRIQVRNGEVHHDKEQQRVSNTLKLCSSDIFHFFHAEDNILAVLQRMKRMICTIHQSQYLDSCVVWMMENKKCFKDLSFWDYSLLVQARICHSCETQDLLSEKTADSNQKNASRNSKTAAQESCICGNIFHKT